MTRRQALLQAIAARIVTLSGPAIRIVAVDGVDGAGKSIFADELAVAVDALGRTVVRTGIDGYHNARAVRHRRGRDDPSGFFEDSFDYPALRRYLLEPARRGAGSEIHLARFDHASDEIVSSSTMRVPSNAIIIFDGIFLHRPLLRGDWDFSIFLAVPFDISIARMAARDSGSPDPAASSNRRYVEGQRIYLERCRPSEHATIVIDNSDLDDPVVIADRSKIMPSATGSPAISA